MAIASTDIQHRLSCDAGNSSRVAIVDFANFRITGDTAL
jgi:hypothetical protein